MSVWVALSGYETCSDNSIGLVELTEEQENLMLEEAGEPGYTGSYHVSIERDYDEDEEEGHHWYDDVKWLEFPYTGEIKGTVYFMEE